MTIQSIETQAVPAIPWKNGGGVTRELLTWPGHSGPDCSGPDCSGPDWLLRLSVATIDQDGPFSAFPGVQRWFAVLAGEGVRLDFAGKPHIQRSHAMPYEFDGGNPPYCRLIQGSTLDLNLMSQRGQASMIRMQRDVAFSTTAVWRAMYCVSAGVWRDSAGQSRDLPAHTLLWSDAVDAGTHWFFAATDPSMPVHGFWLSYQTDAAYCSENRFSLGFNI